MRPEQLVEEFTASLPYQLDDFQLEAIRALANRHSVLVAAPTGTGKTIIGQFGIFMARKYGARAIYTTPIKALSNQKYRDFRAIWGDDQVGLLTGDVVVTRDAPILVMTTEVLRNSLVTGHTFAKPSVRQPPGAPQLELGRPTEVLRNMLVTGASIDDVGAVVFDEVHYMGDAERGTAWEESILL